MKNSIKSIFFLLCIGSSVYINAKLEFEINSTIENGLNSYNPNQSVKNPLSLDHAAAQWAHGLVSQLSTTERVSLAYFCLTAKIGPNARQIGKPAVERIVTQMTKGGIPANEQYVRELAKYWEIRLPWGWTTFSDIPVLGGTISLVQGAQKALSTAQYSNNLYWPAVNDFAWEAANNSTTFGTSNQLTNTFFGQLIESIQHDLHSPEFAKNVFLFFGRPITKVNWQEIEPKLQATVAETIRNTYDEAALQAPDNTPAIASTFIQTNHTKLINTFNQVKTQMTKETAPFEPARRKPAKQPQPQGRSFTQDRRNIRLALDYISQRPAGMTKDQLDTMKQNIINWQDQINDNKPLDQTQRSNLDRMIAILETQLRKAKLAEQQRSGWRQKTSARQLEEEEQEWEGEEELARAKTPIKAIKPAIKTAPATTADMKKFVDKFMSKVPQTANRTKVKQKLAEELEKMPIQYPANMKFPSKKRTYRNAQIRGALNYFDTKIWPIE